MKHNQHKTKDARTTFEVIRGNPMFDMSNSYFPISIITPKEQHENLMPNFTKLNRKSK